MLNIPVQYLWTLLLPCWEGIVNMLARAHGLSFFFWTTAATAIKKKGNLITDALSCTQRYFWSMAMTMNFLWRHMYYTPLANYSQCWKHTLSSSFWSGCVDLGYEMKWLACGRWFNASIPKRFWYLPISNEAQSSGVQGNYVCYQNGACEVNLCLNSRV